MTVAEPRLRVVYIAGTGRSGSTLLAQCLERTSTAVHVGELRYVWERGVRENHLCECGEPFDRCPFWTAVMREAYGPRVHDVADQLRRLSPRVDRLRRIPQAATGRGRVFRADVRRWGDLLTPLYRGIATVSGAGCIIDSSKDPSYLYALSTVAALQLDTVHLVRDSRAVAHSWTRRRRRPEIHWEVQYMTTYPPSRTALNWMLYNAAIGVHVGRSVRRDGRATRLRYEDFVAQPEASIAGLRRAVALPRLPEQPGPRGHSLSGNPARFEPGRPIRVDDGWIREMAPSDRRLVTLVTAPLLRRYGYRLRVARPRQPIDPQEWSCTSS